MWERQRAGTGEAAERLPRRGGWVTALVVVAALVAAVLATGHVLSARHAEEHRRLSRQELQAALRLKSAQVSDWYADQRRDVRLIGRDAVLNDLFRRWVRGAATSPRDLRRLLETLRATQGFRRVMLVDRDGRRAVAAGEGGGTELDAEARAAARNAARSVSLSIGDLHADGAVVLVVAAPLMAAGRSTGQARGCVIVVVDAGAELHQVLSTPPTDRAGTRTLVVEPQDGGSRVLSAEGAGDVELAVAASGAPGDVVAAQTVTRVVEGTDHRGRKVLAAVGRVPGTPWSMASVMDLGEASAGDGSPLGLGYAAVAALVAVAGLGIVLVLRSREAGVLRRLLRAERERERVARNYAALTQFANDIILVYDEELRVVDANERAVAAYGYSRDELLSKSLADLRDPDQSSSIDDRLRQLHAGGGRDVFLSRHRRRDGSVFPVEVSVARVELDGRWVWLNVVRDVTERQAAEEALRESEALYRALFESPAEAVMLLGERFEAVNPQSCAMLGYSATELRTMGPAEISPETQPDGRPSRVAAADYVAAALTGTPQFFAWRHRRKDGVEIECEVSLTRVEVGGRALVQAVVRDVTAHRRTEEEARRTGELLARLVEASPVPIHVMDPDGVVLLWNPAATAVFGWTADEVMGRALPLVDDETREEFDRLRARVLAGERLSGLELTRRRKDGSPVDVSVSAAPLLDAGGDAVGIMSVAEDVTERRRSRERLSRLTRLYRVLSEVNEAVVREREPERLCARVCEILVTRGGFRLAWVCRHGRGDEGSGAGVGIDIVGAHGARDDDVATLKAAVAGGAAFTDVALRALSQRCAAVANDLLLEARRTDADLGEQAGYRSCAVVPIVLHDGAAGALGLTSTDVGVFDSDEMELLGQLGDDVSFALAAAAAEARRTAAESELADLNRELEDRVAARTAELAAANQELESFSYSVSHDLRAPLRALDGFSLALMQDYGERLDGTALDYLSRVRSASQRMGQLIDDLLTLSRVSRREMRRDAVDLAVVARDVAAELAAEDPARDVRFVCVDAAPAHGDEHLLRIVLRNLLENAWKFTARTRDAVVEFGISDHGGETAYHVRDNGVGFDPAYADRLFRPFQRLHDAGEFPGSGIGLATVQRIVRRHGGMVWADGRPGAGVTVTFTVGTGAGDGEGSAQRETAGGRRHGEGET